MSMWFKKKEAIFKIGEKVYFPNPYEYYYEGIIVSVKENKDWEGRDFFLYLIKYTEDLKGDVYSKDGKNRIGSKVIKKNVEKLKRVDESKLFTKE